MGRRRFDHLVAELSVTLGFLIPRYELWLAAQECGPAPEVWSRSDAVHFCRGPLRRFLIERQLRLERREMSQLRRRVARFDPRVKTPEEHALLLHG